jgi:aminomethyltransferase
LLDLARRLDDPDLWRDRLRDAGLAPAERDGRAQVLIVAADSKYLGVPFREVSFSVLVAEHRGVPVVVCRTGYTGEHGYELLIDADRAGDLWDALLDAGQDLGIRPCGLGARDTLRTEMGYPLHGHELSREITPNQARAGWAVGWKKPAFWGRDALLAERETGPARLLWGLRASGRGIPRPGMPVLDAEGTRVGEVTSGTFSPTLRTGIGLALIDTAAGTDEGGELVVDVRGRPQPVEVVRPPFVPSHVR